MDLLAHLSKSPKNMLSKDLKSESNGDLFWALNKVHDLIEMMTGSSITIYVSFCDIIIFFLNNKIIFEIRISLKHQHTVKYEVLAENCNFDVFPQWKLLAILTGRTAAASCSTL